MKSELLERILKSPVLPELIDAAQSALEKEQQRRREFHTAVQCDPEQKWEFIHGEVVMHSPALNRHLLASQHLFKLMDLYVAARRCGQVRTEKAMTVFPRNDYEPDICFFGPAKSALISPDTLKFPVPDFVAEILSPNTEQRDRGVKFEDYAMHGVQEYWIIDPAAETVEPYRLEGEKYPPVSRQKDGILSSDVVPGFEISVRAIFNEEENLAAVRRILARS